MVSKEFLKTVARPFKKIKGHLTYGLNPFTGNVTKRTSPFFGLNPFGGDLPMGRLILRSKSILKAIVLHRFRI